MDEYWLALSKEQLFSRSTDENREIRARTAMELGAFRGEDVKNILIDLAQDMDADVRYHAVWSLENFNGEDVKELLKRIANKEHEFDCITEKAAESLEKINQLRGSK